MQVSARIYFKKCRENWLNEHYAEPLLFLFTSDHHCSLTKLTRTTVSAAVYEDYLSGSFSGYEHVNN